MTTIDDKSLASLGFRKREIIKLRYGFYGYCYTLEEVGRILKMNRNRVSKMEKEAVAKLSQQRK